MKQFSASCLAYISITFQILAVLSKKLNSRDQAVPGSLSAAALFGDGGNCLEHKCSPGMVPKIDYHQISTTNGSSDEECCSKTCELFVNISGCGEGYLPNPAYFRNVEYSTQKCCDAMCQDDFQCTEPGYKSKGPSARGHSIEECCGATCSLFACTDGYANSSSRANDIGSTTSECCETTCAMFNCTETEGWFANCAATDTIITSLAANSSSREVCCVAQCSLIAGQCATGYGVPESMDDTTGSNETCCTEQCGHVTCDLGWDANVSKALEFGSSTEQCCIKTCALYTCSGDWAPTQNSTKLASQNLTNETCCEASCQAYTCGDGWLRNDDVVAEAGSADDVCCNKTCSLHSCPSGYRNRINSAINASLAVSDDFCCEVEGCARFDNLSALHSKQCSDLSEDECGASYIIANTSNSTAAVQCVWHQLGNSSIYTCRTWGTPVFECTVGM